MIFLQFMLNVCITFMKGNLIYPFRAALPGAGLLYREPGCFTGNRAALPGLHSIPHGSAALPLYQQRLDEYFFTRFAVYHIYQEFGGLNSPL